MFSTRWRAGFIGHLGFFEVAIDSQQPAGIFHGSSTVMAPAVPKK